MEENKKSKRYFKDNAFVAMVITITGLVLILISKLKEGFWFSFAYDIGSIILISGIYTILDTYFLKNGLVNLVIEKVNLDKSIDETGLIEIGSNLSEINYKDFLQNAESNIDILHIYGRTWTNTNIDFIKKALTTKKCQVRIILLSPESKFIPALEEHFDYDKGKLTEYISDVTKIWKASYEIVSAKKKYFTDKSYRRIHRKQYENRLYGSIKLYYHKGQPTNSIYRIDDKIIVIETKTSKLKSTNMSYTIYKDNGKCNNLYTIYKHEIDRIVEESEEVILENL